LNTYFPSFIDVHKEQTGERRSTDNDLTSVDFLEGFYLGTRLTLTQKEPAFIIKTINEMNSTSFGLQIATFESVVDCYAIIDNVIFYYDPREKT
jgi:hypothetical protein